ncbi:MAG TPA: aminotransferase class I/II-fold pyridoxal phosphate-dependent enzyme, partial [Nitrospira sp.]|nr:aminotransferase class I/II-fold pyridoxal phosphate-dependent enzyme [Nitrospira sp.]
MAYGSLKKVLDAQLAGIRAKGLYKSERRILGPQGSDILVAQGSVLNLCANNYLGLANHPAIVEAARKGLETHGYGMASVRFICGTQDLHKQLERAVSEFLGNEDTILYGSCFDANGGLFEVLLDEDDAVISDALNHASLIDGIRLCKAKRFRYAHSDMADLEAQLQAAGGCRLRLIVTDGVFSMDGDPAKLDRIVELAERYGAAVVVDDSHATGVLGPQGRGTPAHFGVADRIEMVTST